MKQCAKCGASQSDSRKYCVDCGEKLGKGMTVYEEIAFKRESSSRIDSISSQANAPAVSAMDRVAALFSGICVCMSGAILLFFNDIVSDPVFELLYILVPLFFVCIFFALSPKLHGLWMKIKRAVMKTEDHETSEAYLKIRRLIIYVCFIAGIALFIYVTSDVISQAGGTVGSN